MTIDDFKIGDRVRYIPGHAHGDSSHKDCSDGIVSSKNDTFVFVQYGLMERGQATRPEDLIFIG